MSVLVTVGQKCTLAASHAARWCHVEYTPLAVLKLAKNTGQMDGQMPDRYIALSSLC